MGVITIDKINELQKRLDDDGLNPKTRFEVYRELYHATGLAAFALEAEVSSLQG